MALRTLKLRTTRDNLVTVSLVEKSSRAKHRTQVLIATTDPEVFENFKRQRGFKVIVRTLVENT